MKAILVGLGGRAASWIEACRRKKIEISSYVEPVAAQQEKMAARYQLPKDRIFTTLADAVRKSDAQFVMDITPPAAHESIVLESLKNGLHVLEEKPISDSLAAAKRMVAAAKSAGKVYMITQNYRFGAQPRTARRLLKDGVVGAPEQVMVSFFMPWADAPGSHYVTQPYMLIKDMGVHHFDLLRYVLAQNAEKTLGHSWNPSWGWHQGHASHTAIFQMTGGVTATHHALGCSKGHRSSWNGEWHIAGPEGSVTWEENKIFVTYGHRTKNPSRQEIPLDTLPEGGQDAILTEFFAAIQEGRQPECSGEDNINSLAMTFALVKSSQERRWVDMKEIL
jgi:predicted dehydrogenase